VSALSPGWWETLAVFQARSGLLSQARLYLASEVETRNPSRSRQDLFVRGEIALAENDLGTAIKELEEAQTQLIEWGPRRPGFYLGSESLASALKRRGQVQRAIQTLERSSEKRFEAVINNNAGAYWLRNRFELARLYREVGREKDALAIESELSRHLAFADADHPILIALKKRRKST
jgi:tetratricopeptide (TPR) repeat protein